ncbi:barstar family protein [Streptomyces adelaidensis]|uniref:barstar family protein n=1 Tax=Streptomyces adelaidensis TaxID=2796465 RepID=UPI0019050534|nr:barstar family protein [Streptomyces adelaidensis]
MNWVDLELTAHEPVPASVPVRDEPSAVLRGSACRTEAGLFSEWARVLKFPVHFGRNWDAFHDCLAEKALWHFDPDRPPPAHPFTIRIENAAQLLIDAPAEVLVVLLDVLFDTAAVQRDDEDDGVYADGFRLRVLLRDTPGALPYLVERMRAAGLGR